MATEARRRCGYRKVGGLYLMGSTEGAQPCDRLPLAVSVCPYCNQGIKQARGWTWLDLGKYFDAKAHENCCDIFACPLCDGRIGKAGLLWIGEQFYPTPADFIAEGVELGISRRITAVPRGFVAGETWVLLAHPKAATCAVCAGSGSKPADFEATEPAENLKPIDCEACKGSGKAPGIFYVFKPSRIEKIITQTQSQDPDFMADLAKKGLTPVIVPGNDPDHQGTVYDKEEEPEAAAPAEEAKPADEWLWNGASKVSSDAEIR